MLYTRELVGSYLLCQLPKAIRSKVGLYRDDGLGVFRESARKTELIKKQICSVFGENGLKITIEANKKVVNFFDVTLDLEKNTYEPYMKPGNTPLYVHSDRNHPPSITKNIPLAINRRLNEISSSKEAFDQAASTYQQALGKSRYNHQFQYEPPENKQRSKPTSRSCNISWFNPPPFPLSAKAWQPTWGESF